MSKINPILNSFKINPTKIKYAKSINKVASNPNYTGPLTMATIGSMGLIVSTLLRDYNKTANEENYFQFKTNPDTGKHYEADVFQNAAGMNLYLGNDVLVTAPTGTGKTAIAEYIMTKNLKEGKKTFYTTPLKALSNEKFLDFGRIYGKENVGLLTGDTKINTEAPIIVMTTEIYKNMVEAERFGIFDEDLPKGVPSDLKTVIFDELQYLGDVDRGGVWERSIMFTPKDVQILSLSATIGNNVEINDWIAKSKGRKGIFVTPNKNYRPKNSEKKETVLINVPPENRHVPLSFGIENAAAEIKTPRGGSKKDKIKAKKEGARISQTLFAKPRDESYKMLTRRLRQEDKLPAIYFVFSKKECRHLLKYLSTESELLTTEKEQQEIENIIKKYEKDGIYLGESLNVEALKKGYAIHNAGLLPAQKSLVEELFQKKLVKVVLATETLSAGINMPARTTVISSPRKPSSTSDGGEDKKRNLTPNEFHQMAGRAGRRGIDTEGSCYQISCNNAQAGLYNELIQSPSNRLDSNLDLDYSFIANYIAGFSDDRELEYILSKSLYAHNSDGTINQNRMDEIMEQYTVKKGILMNGKFVDANGRLTTKGHFIKMINGYQQIPLINIVSNPSILGDLNPIQLAGILGGLANIDSHPKDDFMQKPFDVRTADSEFSNVAHIVYDEVKDYETNVAPIFKDVTFKLDSKPMDHLYKWAELNSVEEDGIKNWKELYNGDLRSSIKDEGTLFKEIISTCDLIKQLIEATNKMVKLADSKEEVYYYNDLNEKLRECFAILYKKPVINSSI